MICQATKNESENRWAYQELSKLPGDVTLWDDHSDLQELGRNLQMIQDLDEWTSNLTSYKRDTKKKYQ